MKKIIITLSVLIVIGLLGFAAYKVFLAAKVPQSFIDSHNKIADLQKEIEELSSKDDLPDFEKMIADQDYNGAIKAIDEMLVEEKQAAEKIKAIDSELVVLKSLSGQVSDVKAKETVAKRINLGEKENAARTKYFAIRIQMLEKAREMVVRINKDEKLITAADEKAVEAMVKQIEDMGNQGEKAKSEMEAIQEQYKAAEKEFMETARLSKV